MLLLREKGVVTQSAGPCPMRAPDHVSGRLPLSEAKRSLRSCVWPPRGGDVALPPAGLFWHGRIHHGREDGRRRERMSRIALPVPKRLCGGLYGRSLLLPPSRWRSTLRLIARRRGRCSARWLSRGRSSRQRPTAPRLLRRTGSACRIELSVTGPAPIEDGRFWQAWLENSHAILVVICTPSGARHVSLYSPSW
jgi:hypothetical protein